MAYSALTASGSAPAYRASLRFWSRSNLCPLIWPATVALAPVFSAVILAEVTSMDFSILTPKEARAPIAATASLMLSASLAAASAALSLPAASLKDSSVTCLRNWPWSNVSSLPLTCWSMALFLALISFSSSLAFTCAESEPNLAMVCSRSSCVRSAWEAWEKLSSCTLDCLALRSYNLVSAVETAFRASSYFSAVLDPKPKDSQIASEVKAKDSEAEVLRTAASVNLVRFSLANSRLRSATLIPEIPRSSSTVTPASEALLVLIQSCKVLSRDLSFSSSVSTPSAALLLASLVRIIAAPTAVARGMMIPKEAMRAVTETCKPLIPTVLFSKAGGNKYKTPTSCVACWPKATIGFVPPWTCTKKSPTW